MKMFSPLKPESWPAGPRCGPDRGGVRLGRGTGGRLLISGPFTRPRLPKAMQTDWASQVVSLPTGKSKCQRSLPTTDS